MRYKKKNGFALIYTILIGALVLISIVGITMRIVPENTITKARTNSQRALAAAETGVSQVLFDLRNFGTDSEHHPNDYNPNSGSSHYLTTSDIKNLIDSTGGVTTYSPYVTNPTSSSSDNFETSYQAKIKVNSNNTADNKLDVELYVLGTVKDRSGNVLAGDAVDTNFTIDYKIEPVYGIEKVWVPGTSSGVFNYALYSGGDIVFGGSAQTVEGSIHAVGTIDLGHQQNQVRVGNGNAEGEKNVTGSGIVNGQTLEGKDAPSVPFPELNIDAYKGLADAFRSGTAPYDGLTPNFPKITDSHVLSVIQSYLGAPGSSSSLAGINNFYDDLKNGTTGLSQAELTAANLNLTTAKSIVYYVKGDTQGNVTINGNFACIGTLVVDGNLKINGHATIGDPSDPGAAAILVKGDVDLSNGTADLYGLFYATGGITGNGTFYCEGSIATKGTIDITGNYTVKYHDITNPNLGISDLGDYKTQPTSEPTSYNYSVTSAAGAGISSSPSSYTWKEISYDKFQNP
jgi:hypothetical protein